MGCTAPCSAAEVATQFPDEDFQAEWESLLRRSYDNRIFLTPTWQRLWSGHFEPRESYLLYLRTELGELEAVLPLQVVETDGVRVLTLLGDHNVADYMDGAAEKHCAEPLLGQLWDEAWHLLRWDRIELRHVPSTSPLLTAIDRAAIRHNTSAVIEVDEVCPVALLCSTWEAYLQMLSKKQRHEIRRKLRRAQEDTECSWRTAQTQEELERDLQVFFQLHELSVRHKAEFLTPPMRSFFEGMARELLQLGLLRLSTFRRDGQDVAAVMGFLHHDRYLLYNSGYDPASAAQSPGIAAVAHAMQDAIDEKAVAFDFLSGNEPYKYQFGATDTYTRRVTVQR